ncbi:unnamed protein product [Rotaria socialis]|uniref:GH16 domain-containing protein n=1 Tax=Rotaria socialis TaxID=392032 RepID=A0A818M542_9BILA|nr:unnamed protein product [Rotaria socialis]CAF4680145.1 unnamed protein product [Rotaria socialis]
MIRITLIFLLTIPSIYTDTEATLGQSRIFYEPFNAPPLNTSVWNTGYPWGSYYNHRANTISRQAKVTQEGFLNLTATRERSLILGLSTEYGPIDLDFTSGAVNTNGKFCIKNGYVEISLQVPAAESTWPTVFLVPEDQGAIPMLTIMEVFNSRSQYSYGLKYTNNQGEVKEESFVALNSSTSNVIHRYGLDWGYDLITWYYDDVLVNTITRSDELRQVNNMCLVIGLGVGGKSKDTPINPETYPAIMSIDLLEIWQPNYDGFYQFQNVQTGFLMEIDNASHNWGARVFQWPDNGGDWQKWHVQYAGRGQYRIITAHSRLGLDSEDWGTNDGTNLIQWPYHAGGNQLWRVQPVLGSSPDVVQLINMFTITNSNAGKLVSVPTNDISAGVQLQLWTDQNSDLQKWKMIRV